MKQESCMLEVNDLHMHVVTAGEGPPVLLLHGFPDTHAVWRKQMEPLAEAGYQVIAPDLRGYGRTDAPAHVGSYSLDHLRADVLALLDALGIERVRLVGHDWGSFIGWTLCMHAPSRVDRFVALSTGHPAAIAHAGVIQNLRLAYILGFIIPGFAEHALKVGNWFFLRQFTRDRIQVANWRRCLGQPGRLTAALNYYRANISLGFPRRWPAVAVPVMGIWSDGDPVLGEKQMLDSGRYVQDEFRYERIEGADHWPQVTKPDQFNALLLDYFRTRAKPYSAAL